MVFKKLLSSTSGQRQSDRQAELYRNFIRHEAKIGGKLFGPVPKGHRRDFFCLDQKTWVWHEEWIQDGQRQVRTTRYDVRPDGILKAQDGQNYQRIGAEEAKNLKAAALAYRRHVKDEIYNFI
ncbi:MAG: hypothetical protein ABI221_01390 [Candidatus Saccharimonadales bacterium]